MPLHVTSFGIGLLAVLLLAGCVTNPPPKVVMENEVTRIEIRTDERATRPHAHPAPLSPETMRALLSGMRIQVQTDRLFGVVNGWSAPRPVFSQTDLAAISGPLAEALAQAASHEIVTFYRRVNDASIGLAYTTGGLFVQEGLVYMVMANFWSLPVDAIVPAVPGYMIDPIDQPLLTLGRKFYLLSHKQEQADVHLPDWQERHPADKTLVVNLSLLRPENGRVAPRTSP
ncbi:MAG: hypothetical protein NTX84_05225 [Nitrospirae bacterium]|nr:hypothetical protein [Nitrospirota bacterium]